MDHGEGNKPKTGRELSSAKRPWVKTPYDSFLNLYIP